MKYCWLHFHEYSKYVSPVRMNWIMYKRQSSLNILIVHLLCIRWLVISSALMSHPVLLSPSNRIGMSSLYLCITGISRQMKLPIVLLPFQNICTRAVSSILKEGCILASVSACMSTCKRLQTEWPQMIAERTIPTVLQYWAMKFERNKKQLTFGDDHEIESWSTRTRQTSWQP